MNRINNYFLALILLSSMILSGKAQLIVEPLENKTAKPLRLQFIDQKEFRQVIVGKNEKYSEPLLFDLSKNDMLRLELYEGYLIVFYIEAAHKNNIVSLSLYDSTYTQIAHSSTSLNDDGDYDILLPLIAISETIGGTKIVRPSDRTINAIKKPSVIKKREKDSDLEDWTLID